MRFPRSLANGSKTAVSLDFTGLPACLDCLDKGMSGATFPYNSVSQLTDQALVMCS
ncbi:hypothetical protein PSEUDO9AG_40413 [Pseudomonas sp. 9Ag]|nr:hypothetical protein PSEUDO9AG_40413 [Pseudomonas sp. 9Ag]